MESLCKKKGVYVKVGDNKGYSTNMFITTIYSLEDNDILEKEMVFLAEETIKRKWLIIIVMS